MNRSGDVIIVGAGIVGAACAYELVGAGVNVHVVESGTCGGKATAAAMGHIVVMDDSPAQIALTHFSQQIWYEHSGGLDIATEYDPCGTIWVAADDEEMDAVKKKHAYYGEHGVATEILDETSLAEAEPELRRPLAGGLFVPGDSVIYPPAATQWLLDRARARGATVEYGVAVARVSSGTVTLEDGTERRADAVINAAGNHALTLLPRALDNVAIEPRKGHLVITERHPGFCHHQLVELGYLKSAHTHATSSVAFNIQPRKTGQVLVGSSRQYGRTSPEVETAMVSRMLRRAEDLMPNLGRLTALRAWAGFRGATEDKLPLIGEVPDEPGLFLAAGHEGLGITTSMGTARLIADAILSRTSAIDPLPYRVDRHREEKIGA